MEFVHIICPNSTSVWDGNGFSKCFSDMVLGFGANLVTILMIFVLGITRKSIRGVYQQANLSDKVVLHFLPALAAVIGFIDMVFLLKKALQGEIVTAQEWFFRWSQFLVWNSFLLFPKLDGQHIIFRNRILCFWWIVKLLLGISHLELFVSSSEMLPCFKEGCLVLLDITFGISINIIRYKRVSSRVSLLEEPLLNGDVDLEEGYIKNSGAANSFWHLLTFKSINPVMSQGVIKQLSFEDLLQLPTDMDLSSYHQTMLSCWQTELRNNSSSLSLFRAIYYAYGWSYFRLGLLKILNDSLGFAGPLLLNKLIRFLQRGSGHLDGLVLALSLGLASILKSFLDTQYSFHLSKLKLKLRSSIMTMIYQKCLSVSLAERLKFSEGEIQTYMSIDADRTVNICNSFHDLWSLPLQIGVALYLLYTQVKFAFVAGVAIIILLIPVNKWIANLIATATEKMMKQKDERIRRTGELLTYIRTIKIYGWELLFTGWLMKTRSLEVTHLSTRKYLDAWCVFFWATTPTLFSLFTFGLYTLMGNQLDAAVVFTCVALFNTLISPLNSFPWVINGLIDSFISTRRLSRFLSSYEHKPKLEQEVDYSPSFSNGRCDDTHEDMAVVIHDACCAWSISDQKEQTMVLNNVTLGIPKGSLVAVIGEVGSGKSSLLNSILGEMRLTHGSIRASGNLAYVPQVPWVLSGTIRDNILFEKDYDQDRYADVLQACALDVDISLMLGGDMAYIGEKGTNLSGGQRARLALARAIYYGADIFLFDDVLSAVDAQVARWILYSVLLGPLTAKKTRILCTHNVQAISSADMIILMDKGHIKWVGSSAAFSGSSHSLTGPLKVTNTPKVQKHECTINTSMEVDQILDSDKYILPNSNEAREIVEVEMRRKGKVEIAVYKSYASFTGWSITVIICLSAILMQASRNGNDLWLSYWVDTTTDRNRTEHSTSSYLVILCIFAVVNSSLTLVRAFSFAYGGLHAAVQVHNTLINKLVNAPVNFFDRTPGGRILNRFSSDLYTIDDSLPFILNILLANLIGLLGIVVVLSYVQVLFLLLLLPFWYIYSKLQLYYRSTSRELRRLDSVSRSPIYASFTEALDGSSTIRAFKSENFFLAKFTNHLAMYQRTSYSDIIASLWLSLRLQLMGAFVITFVAVMAVVGSRGNLPLSFGTPGLVGLALSYAAPIVSLLGSFLTSFAETEKEMVSVERILQYMDVAQEDLHGSRPVCPDWPLQGLVEFQNISLRYMPSLPAALNDVTFTIQRGVQVGVVGRTGAGKSSVLNALFRLAPICKGRILVDGINIADISVRDLRAHFAVVPQSPFLFEGTLRDNLDPFQKSDDLKLWNVLEKCHIKEEVQAAGGLETLVKESGTSFSVGQRQLLCLARALLKSSKILCLDECTASVDSRTASVLQNTISSECRGMTVITIAHRISTVLNMDNILILDQGTLVEEGNPQVLLQNQFSRFSSFAKASTM